MKIFKLGDQGSAVAYIQGLCLYHGFPVTNDGIFGPQTEAAIKAIQKRNGLVSDGIVGPATHALLGTVINFKHEYHDKELVLAPSDKLPVTGTTWDLRIREAYNNYGNALAEVAPVLYVDLASLLAVVAVESAGVGLQGGRPVIRFEVHQFFRRWGKYHRIDFMKNFKYDLNVPWKGHRFLRNGTWSHVHGQQHLEWEAYELARGFHAETATQVISMGMAQLMGWHHKDLGYTSALEMLRAMHEPKNQLIGLMDYLCSDYNLITSLQEQDWYHFAYYYNGPGQPQTYQVWLQQAYWAAKDIIQRLP